MLPSTPNKEALSVIQLVEELQSQAEETLIKGAIEELPGVHRVEFPERRIEVRFDPEMVCAQILSRAIREAGFVARRIA